jgi:hypothetical protein
MSNESTLSLTKDDQLLILLREFLSSKEKISSLSIELLNAISALPKLPDQFNSLLEFNSQQQAYGRREEEIISLKNQLGSLEKQQESARIEIHNLMPRLIWIKSGDNAIAIQTNDWPSSNGSILIREWNEYLPVLRCKIIN